MDGIGRFYYPGLACQCTGYGWGPSDFCALNGKNLTAFQLIQRRS
jgi:hypothetical protein